MMAYDRLAWFMRSTAMVATICLFGSACTVNRVLRKDFHQPSSRDRLPLKVALLLNESAVPKHLRVDIPHGITQLDIRLGLLSATKSELDAVFDEVTIVQESAQSKDRDFLVVVSPLCAPPCTEYKSNLRSSKFGISLDFQDPSSGRTILKFEHQGELPVMKAGWANFGAIPGLWFLWAIAPQTQSTKVEKYAEKALSDSLASISKEIREGRVMALRRAQGRAKESEKKGDSAKKAGNSGAAFDHYTAALKDAWFGSKVDVRVREKYLGMAASKGSLPKVPAEAKRHMIRGQTMLKKLKDKEGYGEVVAEFEKAVQAAPWWVEAYFNLALMQEKAGDPVSAMRNLKLYLVAKPRAKDAGAVNRKIIELELKVEGLK